MTVNMPVKCIGSICQSCPELDINITTIWVGFGEVPINSLICAHYERCLKVKEYLETNREENKE